MAVSIGIIGSVRTPIKRALIEMVKFGALARHKGCWLSCNDVRFFDSTAITLISKQLAIYSINEKKPGQQFLRLTEAGITLARVIIAERDARKITAAAAEATIAEIARLNEAMA